MSVTFSINHRRTDDDEHWMDLANVNAARLLEWLGILVDHLVGEMPAREVAALCRRRLWPEPRNFDPATPDEVSGRMYCFGRPAGYLRQRTAELLELAELAGDGLISWG
jgi:hypothetical protein